MAALSFRDALLGLRALPAAPDWAKGVTPIHDAEFLLEMVAAYTPAHVIELGVAAGVSSAYLLYALDSLADVDGGRQLTSCDITASCYFDTSHAIGEARQTIYPSPRARWVLDTNMDARRLSQTLAPRSVDLTFIDANHYHPWPLLDLLHVTEIARPESWVVLHDINLPTIAPQVTASGAAWLFDSWPFDKLSGGGPQRNIGAVKLPADLKRLVPYALALLDRIWEHAPTLWHVALPEPFAPIQDRIRARLEKIA
jgi:predicted O-methyltransferase YrrM